MKVLSIDIGGTNFRVGIVSESGTVEKLDRIPTGSVIRSGDVLEDLFELQKGDMTAEAKRDTTIIATYEPKDFDKTTVQEGQIVFTKDGKVVVGDGVLLVNDFKCLEI